jgi:hypothetical protein
MLQRSADRSVFDGEQRHVVQVGVPDAGEGRGGDLHDDQFDEELHGRGEQVAGMRRGGVFLQPEAGVQVGQQGSGVGVAGQGSGAEGLNVA